jgi:hypothetical protein
MLTITVNGSETKLNIGCRTFISLAETLKMLNSADQEVNYNGETTLSSEFGKIFVKGGDTIRLK